LRSFSALISQAPPIWDEHVFDHLRFAVLVIKQFRGKKGSPHTAPEAKKAHDELVPLFRRDEVVHRKNGIKLPHSKSRVVSEVDNEAERDAGAIERLAGVAQADVV
jgi:hypothetical protein